MHSSRDILCATKGKGGRDDSQLTAESQVIVYYKPKIQLHENSTQHKLGITTYTYNLGPLSAGALIPRAVLGLMEALNAETRDIDRRSQGELVVTVPNKYSKTLLHKYVFSSSDDLIFSPVFDLSRQSPIIIDKLFRDTLRCKFIDKQPIVLQVVVGENVKNIVARLNDKMCAASKVDGMEPDRVYILGSVVGTGSFGVVYQHRATLKYDYARGRVCVKEKLGKKVSKLLYRHKSGYRNGAEYDQDLVANECKYMRTLGYFGNVRHSQIVIDNEAAGVVVSKRFPGRDMMHLLDEDRYLRIGKRYDEYDETGFDDTSRFKKLSIEDRFLLSIAMAKALHIVHAGQVKHLDVKPANMIASQSLLTWRVRLIDTGLSQMHNEDVQSRGTVLYVAPEFDDALTQISDVFSLGRVMGVLWGDEEFFDCANLMNNYEFFKRLHGLDSRKLKLFNGIGINAKDEYARSISSILHAMVLKKPSARPNLCGASGVIHTFQHEYQEYIIMRDNICAPDVFVVRAAGSCARSLDNILNKEFGNEPTDEALDSIKWKIQHLYLPNEDAFGQIEAAQKLFKQTLGFRCLESSKLNSFAEIKTKMTGIIDQFAQAKRYLNEKIPELITEHNRSRNRKSGNPEELQSIISGVGVIQEKIKKCPPNLDDMQEVTKHIYRKAAKIQSALERYRKSLQSDLACNELIMRRKY